MHHHAPGRHASYEPRRSYEPLRPDLQAPKHVRSALCRSEFGALLRHHSHRHSYWRSHTDEAWEAARSPDEDVVTRQAWVQFMADRGGCDAGRSPRDIAADLFRMIDADGSGQISPKELRQFLAEAGETETSSSHEQNQMSDEDIDEVTRSIDSDDDQVISQKELEQFLHRFLDQAAAT
jgi:Ca2+-binding EF-hand superfamily protein